MISGVLINMRIRVYFKEFYDENYKILWSATFFLSVPLIFRGTLDILRVTNEELEDFIQ